MALVILCALFNVLGAVCSQSEDSVHACMYNSCEGVAGYEICTRCRPESIPLDGVCVSSDLPNVGAVGCVENDGRCERCSADGYFLYMGGCYQTMSEPGNMLCKEATDGACTVPAPGYVLIPSANHPQRILIPYQNPLSAAVGSDVRTDSSNKGCSSPLGTVISTPTKPLEYRGCFTMDSDEYFMPGIESIERLKPISEKECREFSVSNSVSVGGTDKNEYLQCTTMDLWGIFRCYVCELTSPIHKVSVSCNACTEGYKFGPSNMTCLETCPANSVEAAHSCSCNEGFSPSADGLTCEQEQSCSSEVEQNACSKCNANDECLICKNKGDRIQLNRRGCVKTCPKMSAIHRDNRCSCFDGYMPNIDKSACIKEVSCKTENCMMCSTDGCILCIENFFLTPTRECATSCTLLPGYYATTTEPLKCLPCSVSNCAECTPTGACGSCKKGFYVTADACQPCHGACEECTGPSERDCTVCPVGKILIYIGATGRCIDECSESTTSFSGNCRTCGLVVTGTKYCSACSVDSEYPQDGICGTEAAQASACQDNAVMDGVCRSCAPGYFLMNGGCYTTTRLPGQEVCNQADGGLCSQTTPGYRLLGSMLVACSQGCAVCQSESNCTACLAGYVLKGVACVQCDPSCEACSSTGPAGCTTCAIGYYKTNKASNVCTPCRKSSGTLKGVPGCQSCAPPVLGSGPVICYLISISTFSTETIIGISLLAVLISGSLISFLCWWFTCHKKARKNSPIKLNE